MKARSRPPPDDGDSYGKDGLDLDKSLALLHLTIQLSQVAETADGQTAGIPQPLFGQAPDVPCKVAPHRVVQIMSGHPAVNLQRSKERFCDLDMGHGRQLMSSAMVPR